MYTDENNLQEHSRNEGIKMKRKCPNPWNCFVGLFPILKWSKTYDFETAIGDLIAGITIALTLIPQSIGYAALAGLEPQYGLYASFMGLFVYAFMGSCPQINIGPTALLSLLTATYTSGTNPDFAVLLCFVAGVIQLVAGITQLGFLVGLVSLPVVSGFTSAAALTIASSQVKGLLGLSFSGEKFITIWKAVILNIKETRMADALLSVACCSLLIGMKSLKDIRIKGDDERRRKIIQKALWFASVGRNAAAVIVASVFAFLIYQDKRTPFILTGEITPGIPRPTAPAFHTTLGNTTYTTLDMLTYLGSGLWVVPLVGIISNVAIAKSFANGKTLDATQEILALGVCNLVNSFFRSLPVNGAFSRSAVSNASGVRTPAAGIYTGILVILTLLLLTPYFYFIPRAALSSVIVCAVLQMVDTDMVLKLWRTSRLDLIPLIGTFLCCLGIGVELGLICGVGLDALLLLYYNSRPPLSLQYVNDIDLPPHFSVHPVGGLHYVGAEKVRFELSELKNSNHLKSSLKSVDVMSGNDIDNNNKGIRNRNTEQVNRRNPLEISNQYKILVVYCDGLYRVDYTFLENWKMLVNEWSHGGRVVWCNANAEIKRRLLCVIKDPIFCKTEELRAVLTGLTNGSEMSVVP